MNEKIIIPTIINNIKNITDRYLTIIDCNTIETPLNIDFTNILGNNGQIVRICIINNNNNNVRINGMIGLTNNEYYYYNNWYKIN